MASADDIQALRDKISAIESSSAAHHRISPARTDPSVPGGQVQSDGRKGESRSANDAGDAFSRIVSLVNASDKSEKTIRERLGSLGFEEAAIEEAVEKAKRYSIVDDDRYAEVLVRSRISQGRGLEGIARELERNGIDPSSLDFWEETREQSEDSELSRALDMLRKKPPRSKNLREGAYRKLMQKGYSSATASSAARIWLEEQAVR